MTVMISITYGNYQSEQLRKGADDDVVVNLRISEVISDHGEVDTYRGVATLRLKALSVPSTEHAISAWLIGILKPIINYYILYIVYFVV